MSRVASIPFLIAIFTALRAHGAELEDVAFEIQHATVPGQSVYVLGNIPELGGNNAAYSVKLEPGAYPMWRAKIAIPKGTSFNYQYIWRSDGVSQWSNAGNSNPIGGDIDDSTDARTVADHIAYYHSGWNPPTIFWRAAGTGAAYLSQAMTEIGGGRTANEKRWRAAGLGPADREIEFYFTNGAAGRDPVGGTYSTALYELFVQDGQVFSYVPAATVGNPQQSNFPTFFSTNLGENRPYRVVLPRGYAQHTTRRYPVLYLHDGQNVFDMGPFGTWNADETARDMIRGGKMREVILVGVDNTANRIWDYLPPDDTVPFGPGAGGPGRADKYAAFLINELKPVIDSTYRTLADRDNTATLGSSMGGIVSLYLGWDRNSVFRRIGPISGAWTVSPNFVNRVYAQPIRDLMSYLDSGDSGASNDNAWPTMTLRDRLLAKGYVLERNLKHVVGYGHQHNEAAWAARLPAAYKFLFPATDDANLLPPAPAAENAESSVEAQSKERLDIRP